MNTPNTVADSAMELLGKLLPEGLCGRTSIDDIVSRIGFDGLAGTPTAVQSIVLPVASKARTAR